MCGIFGFINTGQDNNYDNINQLHNATNTLKQRGPNSFGFWINEELGVYLGHRRLSILDLSSSGNQPMISSNKRYILILNGEIYNHLEIRKKIKGYGVIWKSTSDTETLLETIAIYGLQESLKIIRGMFSFALFDILNQELFLIKDRFGEKPLYYGFLNNKFLFSSELKALKAIKTLDLEIDESSISTFIRFGYIPTPNSIYKNIFKLEPGQYIKYNIKTRVFKKSIYWSILDTITHGINNPFSGSENEAIIELEKILNKSVSDQMISDVPIGAFLSAGIDSSLIVSLMRNHSKSVNTFSIGFDDELFNEAKYSKVIASILGTNHTDLYISEKEASDTIPDLINIYDEPFADSSQIPTFLVSKLAKNHVSVVLSGDGGDELFGGYNRYVLASRGLNFKKNIPLEIRTILSNLLLNISPQQYNFLANYLNKFGILKGQHNIGDKMHKALNIFRCNSNFDIYKSLVSTCNNPANILKKNIESDQLFHLFNDPKIKKLDFISQMMAIDSLTYLCDDILCKVDRASMAVSLETRVPYLDLSVAEFAWSLPINYKVKNDKGKYILRQLLKKYLPNNIVEGPKRGFSIPLDKWLRNELRDWAESLLSKNKINHYGYLNFEFTNKIWLQHLSGKRNWGTTLWNILVLQMWLENNKSSKFLQ